MAMTGKWKCLKCMKEFSNKANGQRHYRDAHLTFEMQTCGVCGKQLTNVTSLHKHIRLMHGLRPTDLEKRIIPGPRNH